MFFIMKQSNKKNYKTKIISHQNVIKQNANYICEVKRKKYTINMKVSKQNLPLKRLTSQTFYIVLSTTASYLYTHA